MCSLGETTAFKNSLLDPTKLISCPIHFSTEILISGGGRTFLIAKAQKVCASKQLEEQAKHHPMVSHEPRILLGLYLLWTLTGLGPSGPNPNTCVCVNEVPDNTEMKSRNEKQN